MADERITFSARGQEGPINAFESIRESAIRTRKEIEQTFKGMGKAAKRGSREAVTAQRATDRVMAQSQAQRVRKLEQQERARKRRIEARERKELRDLEQRLKKEERIKERAIKKEQQQQQRYYAKQQRKAEQFRKRQTRRELKEYESRRRRVRRVAGRGASLAGDALGIIAAGITAGGVRAFRSDVQTNDRARQISRQGRGALSPDEVKKALDNSVTSVSGATRQGSADALSTFVSKTGDLKTGVGLLDTINQIAIASNSQVGDVAGVAASLSTNSDIQSLDEFRQVLSGLVLQGKKGAVEFNTLATQVEKVTAGARKFNLTGVEGVATAGGLLQLAKQNTGSVEEAGTALTSVFTNLESKSTTIRRMTGARVFSDADKSKARDIRTVLAEVISGSKGNREVLNQIFGRRGIKAVGSLVSVADQARAGTDGSEKEKQKAAFDAVTAEIDRFADTTGAAAEVQSDLAKAQQDASVRTAAATEKLEVAFGKLITPTLIKAMEQLATAVTDVTEAMGLISGDRETNMQTEATKADQKAKDAALNLAALRGDQQLLQGKKDAGEQLSEADEARLAAVNEAIPGAERESVRTRMIADSQKETIKNRKDAKEAMNKDKLFSNEARAFIDTAGGASLLTAAGGPNVVAEGADALEDGYAQARQLMDQIMGNGPSGGLGGESGGGGVTALDANAKQGASTLASFTAMLQQAASAAAEFEQNARKGGRRGAYQD